MGIDAGVVPVTPDREDLLRPVELGDLDACVRTVDAIVAARDWDSLLWFADRCRAACETGHQLWPAAEYALARAALDAPGEVAGQTLFESTVQVGLGPRAEIAASTHTWEALAPTAPFGPVAVAALYERVVRGEDLRALRDDELPGPVLFDLPRVLEAWEPEYSLATYRSDRVEVPVPPRPPTTAYELSRGGPGDALDADDEELSGARHALAAIGRAWVGEEDVVVRSAVVDGGLDAAIAALAGGVPTRRRADIPGAIGLAHLAWAAASGGPEGRRRGAAVGRADAWHIVAGIAGFDAADPLDPDAIGEALGEIQWAWWDDGTPRSEWALGLAIADPLDGIAWAVELR